MLVCLIISATAQTEKLESGIDSIMKQYQMIGLSVAVVKKGKIVYTHAFGLKNIETNTPLTRMIFFA